MSTAPPPSDHSKDGLPATRKITSLAVYGHSNLLYWWPVWMVSFILAAVSYAEGKQMAVVPGRTEFHKVTIDGEERDALVAPKGKTISLAPGEEKGSTPGMSVSSNNNLGVVFVATLLVVAISSSILLRGLVSMVAVVLMVTVVVTFALFGWWNTILWELGQFDIRMNAAGYMAVGVPLLLAWLFVVFVYDRQHYVVFDQGQIRYVLDVGDSEVAMQSEGAVVEKKRNDVFRHWMLGFGTGDLVIQVGGPNGRTIELENVINIGRKLVIVDKMIKEKAITVEA